MLKYFKYSLNTCTHLFLSFVNKIEPSTPRRSFGSLCVNTDCSCPSILYSLASPDMGHWGTCPLHFRPFIFSVHFRATQSLTATLRSCLCKHLFTVLFGVILRATNSFHVVLCEIVPHQIHRLYLLVKGGLCFVHVGGRG